MLQKYRKPYVRIIQLFLAVLFVSQISAARAQQQVSSGYVNIGVNNTTLIMQGPNETLALGDDNITPGIVCYGLEVPPTNPTITFNASTTPGVVGSQIGSYTYYDTDGSGDDQSNVLYWTPTAPGTYYLTVYVNFGGSTGSNCAEPNGVSTQPIFETINVICPGAESGGVCIN